MPRLFRFAESTGAPRPVLCPKPNPAIPLTQRVATFRRSLEAGEATSFGSACPDCGAPAWDLCYSLTGLPASAPCTARPREAAA
jgi:hypothetical protein